MLEKDTDMACQAHSSALRKGILLIAEAWDVVSS